MRRSTARRDRAILLTLLDTGLRASELCALRTSHLDLKTRSVAVVHGAQGGEVEGFPRSGMFKGKCVAHSQRNFTSAGT
jgi:integrase/recombinase XerD